MNIGNWLLSCWSSPKYSDTNLDSYITKVNGIVARRDSGWRFLGDKTRLSSLKDKIIREYQKPSDTNAKTVKSPKIHDVFKKINSIILDTTILESINQENIRIIAVRTELLKNISFKKKELLLKTLENEVNDPIVLSKEGGCFTYKFSDQIYKGEDALKEGIENWVSQNIENLKKLQNMANGNFKSGDSSTPSKLTDQPNAATIDSTQLITPFENVEQKKSIKKTSETALQHNPKKKLTSGEEQPNPPVNPPTGDQDALNTSSFEKQTEIAVGSESSFSDPTALSLVDDINNKPRSLFFTFRDAVEQDLCNSFPAGFRIVDDYKRQQGDISEDLHNIIAILEDPEIFPDGSPYSGLQLVKIIDDIYNIARENVNALIQQKERELSSLYQKLNPNNEETRTKLFLGYMQSDAVMIQLKNALNDIPNQDSALKALLEKLNEFIKTTPNLKELRFNSLGDFKNLFDFFTEFHLLGALSSPKLELWPPHLGQETVSSLTKTVTTTGLTPEFKALNKSDSEGPVEYPILPTILYHNEKGKSSSFAGNLSSTTYFFHA